MSTDEMTGILANVVVEARKVADRLESAIADAREVTREAHGVVSDLERATKQAHEVIERNTTLITDVTGEAINAKLKIGLDALEGAMRDAMAASVDKVYSEFDKLTRLLMGEGGRAKRKGAPSLTELAIGAVEHHGPLLRPRKDKP